MPLILNSKLSAPATTVEPLDLVTPGASKNPRAIPRSLPMHQLPEVMTELEVAAYFNIPIKTLRRMSWEGKGPNFKKARREHLYRRGDIEAWFTSQG